MRTTTQLLAMSLTLVIALPLPAQEKKEGPKPQKLQPAGQGVGTLAKGRKGKGKEAGQIWFLQPSRGQRVELELAEDIKVRVAQPPTKYNDKGFPVKYTPAELRELKGPGNSWGYASDPDSLHSGQTVEVLFGRRKGDAKLLATTIRILAEAPPESKKK